MSRCKTSPKDWLGAFHQLITVLETIVVDRKWVVFIDELPWLGTPRSGFMRALEYFWNSWAVKKNIVVILCGSAASWMTRKLIHNKGGLHNRITRQIHLKPFTLQETENYLKSRHVVLDRYQVLQLYMVTGGIPQYLKDVQPGHSATQTIDRLCFEPQGILVDEFSKLYASLFDRPENHVKIVRGLGDKRKGLTRKQVVETTKLTDGGSISRLLEELESSGFITSYYPFGKQKKEKLFRLTDEYSLFYLQFMEGKKAGGQGTWLKLSDSQAWKSWAGYAFENICLKHIAQIKMAMGVQGVYSESSSFYFAGNQDRAGLQVDLLIDRKDHVINFCEMKFYDGPFTFTKAYAMEMRQKMTTFREVSGTRKQIALTMITAFGLQQNEHSLGLVQQSITMDSLFAFS
jgi:predicted AAA+ superfamily ATPase